MVIRPLISSLAIPASTVQPQAYAALAVSPVSVLPSETQVLMLFAKAVVITVLSI